MNTSINWYQDPAIPRIMVDHKRWNDIVRTLEPTLSTEIVKDKEGYDRNGHHLTDSTNYTCIDNWSDGCWTIRKDSKTDSRYWLLVQDERGRRTAYYTSDDDEKNDPNHRKGYSASKAICGKFEELNGISMADAFGLLKKDESQSDIFAKALLSVNPIVFCDKGYMNFETLYHGYKADISSAYPASGCGILPDIRTIKAIKSTEFPENELTENCLWFTSYGDVGFGSNYFAGSLWYQIFWKFGHHSGGVAKHFNRIADRIADNYRSEEEHGYYIMEPAQYKLDTTFKYFYELKQKSAPDSKEYQEAKGTLNSSIGFWRSHRSTTHNEQMYFPHISLCIYYNYIMFMMKLVEDIQSTGGQIIQILTDSILAKGSLGTIATDEKYLGSFTYEFKDQRFVSFNSGQYAIETNGEYSDIVFKHQGFPGYVVNDYKTETLLDVIDFMEISGIGIYEVIEALNKNTGFWQQFRVKPEEE